MKFGALLMPSHPPERSIGDGVRLDLDELERLDALGFEEAWIGEHFTASWEPCPSPDLLIAQALLRTKRIRLGPLGHLLPYHHPVALAHRVAYLDHMAEGRYQLGVGISALPTDHDLFGLDIGGGTNRRMTFESLDVMTRLWTEGASDFQGEFWKTGAARSELPGLGYHLVPYQKPHPPIAIAGLTPGSDNHKLATTSSPARRVTFPSAWASTPTHRSPRSIGVRWWKARPEPVARRIAASGGSFETSTSPRRMPKRGNSRSTASWVAAGASSSCRSTSAWASVGS
jgi:hypothetical protein